MSYRRKTQKAFAVLVILAVLASARVASAQSTRAVAINIVR
jgi:hypothetical protein